MNLLTKRLSRMAVLVIIAYLLLWIVQYIFKENIRSARLHTKAISPNQEHNKALRAAIASCNSHDMFETAPHPCKGQPFILLLVISSPNNIFRRNVMRRYLNSTYFSSFYEKGPLWRIVFVISRTNNHFLERNVQREIAAKGDILLGRYKDNVKNLVYKTLVGFGWAHCHCSPLYLLKANDDIFVNLRGLFHWLYERNASHNNERNLYMGISTKGQHPIPIRDKSNRFFVSKEEYPYNTYPPYALGGAYLLSKDVLQKLIPLISRFHAFSTEDAYIGMLTSFIGIPPQDNRLFLRNSKPNIWEVCTYLKVLISFGISASDMRKMYVNSLRSETECNHNTGLLAKPNLTTIENLR